MLEAKSNISWKAELDRHVEYWDNRARELSRKINSMVIQDPIEIKRMRDNFLQEMNKDLEKFDKLIHLTPIVYVKINDDTNEIRVENFM